MGATNDFRAGGSCEVIKGALGQRDTGRWGLTPKMRATHGQKLKWDIRVEERDPIGGLKGLEKGKTGPGKHPD